MFLFFGVVAVTGSYFAQVERARRGRRSCSPCRSGCWPRRSWWSTTCATSRPTAARASARWPCGSAARARATLYAVMVYGAFVCAPLPWLLGLGRAVGVAAAAAARAAAGRAGRAHGALAHRRAVAQRRAGAHRAAPARVLRPPLRGDPGELMAELTVDSVQFKLRAPLRAAWGELAEREVLRVRVDFGDGDFGMGEAAPLEPYDGVSLGVRDRRAGCLRGGARARQPALHARRAARRVRRRARRCRRRWRRSTSRSGTAPAGGPASRWRS